MDNDIKRSLKKNIMEKGASLVGFASLQGIDHDYKGSMNGAVSIGVRLDPDVIKKIIKQPSQEYSHEYSKVNSKLMELGKFTAALLDKYEYKSVILAPTIKVDGMADLRTSIPHKTIANLAGLGWIGKTALFITDEFGSAIRLTSVLTDAEISNDPMEKNRCGSCNICTESCPAGAANGKGWTIDSDREEFFDAGLCYETILDIVNRLNIPNTVCGRCIAVCPWTKRYIKRYSRKPIDI